MPIMTLEKRLMGQTGGAGAGRSRQTAYSSRWELCSLQHHFAVTDIRCGYTRMPMPDGDVEESRSTDMGESRMQHTSCHGVSCCQLYQLQGLPDYADESELHRILNGVADIASARVVRDKGSGLSKGFAFLVRGDTLLSVSLSCNAHLQRGAHL